MSKHLKLYTSILFTWIFLIVTTIFFISQINKESEKSSKLLQNTILQEAIAHFNNMVDTRKWNASHGAVYIKAHDGIKPNPYLNNNTLKTDDNKTLIKVNPAWMTRQISEIANIDNDYYYKITSLIPINPNNKADSFEKGALEYFEKNRDSKYYYKFEKKLDNVNKFDFMGSLKVTSKCLNCHAEQGYKLGDIRGGIRVSVPTKVYQENLDSINNDNSTSKYETIIFALIVAILITMYLIKSFSYTSEIEKLNEELEEKVRLRTKELSEVNETLEERVSLEVKKNREKDEAMLTQSRYVAMGEMIGMLAHQWSQPISNIGMQANNILIDIELGAEDSKDIVNDLKDISNETQKLSEMISSFSTLFESDATKSVVKIQEIVDDALSALSAGLEACNIDVQKDYQNKTEIEIVSRELFQVCWNILNNAKDILLNRKIANPKITIIVEENDSEIIIKISDNAGGITDEKYDEVFKLYYSEEKESDGKGLGLYTSSVIVEKELHGSIYVENSSVGADFFIKIPKIPNV